ncbi:AmmeMemoRadiSam system radical SAM enzyme [Hippea alviniae]|uniref:AmmeMemoRadiSam system radical SAM enzyme n=1 Tax=Hippea alviniae TaxID=1279027 RepID=UPI0003B6B99C|nr:AmmeMemoRadiSam system radical SAM enzyme [Hippea alviniae]
MKEAYLYEKLEDKKVQCNLCAFRCKINEDKVGVCDVRKNIDGTLYSLVYGKTVAKAVDPIEKKPLYHFLPGTLSYSIATVGCNFRCLYCQNWQISMYPKIYEGKIVGDDYPPEKVVEDALRTGCKSIAYTYTEPTVFFEYAIDTARIAKDKGLKNIFVTNGYMTKEAIDMMDGLIDAANVDLKSFSDAFYLQICGGARVKHVLDSIEYMKSKGIWVEVTTLIIPNANDDPAELMQIAEHIKSIDPAIPWHVSRFHPAYQFDNVEPTPISVVKNVRQIGLSMGLKYVYVGNIGADEGEHTYCPNCGALLIARYGFEVVSNSIKDGKCPKCGEKIDIVES